MIDQLIFLGSGAAFTVENYHSNVLLQKEDGSRLLIDCGSDVRHSLAAQGFSPQDITNVYVSHLHADHAGGLEWLGFTHYNSPSGKLPNLYISKYLINTLWHHSLKAGMASLAQTHASLDTYFNVHPLDSEVTWNETHFTLVQTVHTYNGPQINSSYGLFFELNGTKILFTTDTQFVPGVLMPFYEKADLIFHDCETMPKVSSVHARFEELAQLPPHIKKKMWLYHYNDGVKKDAQKAGFLGFVPRGKIFEF
jgi:ribonuclease BN (tRNA processing enzyme)